MNKRLLLVSFAAMILAAINLRPGITSLAPLIERIAAELSLGRGVVSLTTALPVLCMGLLAPLAPRLAQRFGLERTITLCLGLLGVSLLMRLWANDGRILIVSAACLGMAIAIIGPLMAGFIKRHFQEQSGRVVGWYSLSMAIGGSGGAVLTGPLSDGFGSWTLALTAWVLPALVAFGVWLAIPSRVESSSAGGAAGLPWRNRRAWLVTFFFSLQAGTFYSLATWLVARYSEAGMSALRANGLFSLFMLIGLPAAFFIPWLAHRFNVRHKLLVVCGVMAAVCLTMITFFPRVVPDIWAVLLGIALTGSFSLSMLLPMHEADSPLDVSRWTAMMLCAGYCIACTVPVLAGIARDIGGTYVVPFSILTLMVVIMAMLAWRLRQRSS